MTRIFSAIPGALFWNVWITGFANRPRCRCCVFLICPTPTWQQLSAAGSIQ
jgi:hypothetical protein